jgi:hypothetical protein
MNCICKQGKLTFCKLIGIQRKGVGTKKVEELKGKVFSILRFLLGVDGFINTHYSTVRTLQVVSHRGSNSIVAHTKLHTQSSMPSSVS